MTILSIVQIAISAALITLIMFQNQGAGLSGVFGGSSEVFNQKRGSEKVIFILTIILAVAFLGTAVLSILL